MVRVLPPNPHLQIQAVSRDEHLVVDVRGDLDLATGPLLEAELHPLVQAESGDLVIDLRDLAFLDSAGATSLSRIAQDVADRDGNLILRHPSRCVRRAIDLCCLGAVPGIEVSA